jgi:acyl dehydratase
VQPYRVVAFNTATASTNKIHDDAVAKEYGFRGGLVPGVDVYAYMTHLPAERWGRAWLDDGSISARFVAPVYDGEEVEVVATDGLDELVLTVTGSDGSTRATGRAALGVARTDRPEPAAGELPAVRPPASPDTLRPGTVLGSISDVFSADRATPYLADVRESLPLYAELGVAHPGWLLRFANSALSRNVELGPWIHVSSEVALCGVVEDGQAIETRAVVLDERQRSGHRFVTLDVTTSAAGRCVQRVTHTAIHTPRRT